MAALNEISVLLNSIRAIDGIVTHCKRIAMAPETYCFNLIKEQGEKLSDHYKIGGITGSEFLLRFDENELYHIQTFAKSGDQVVWPEVGEDWDPELETDQSVIAAVDAAEEQMLIIDSVGGMLKKLAAYPLIRLDDPELVAGMTLLVSLGLVTQERMEEILYYQRPEAA